MPLLDHFRPASTLATRAPGGLVWTSPPLDVVSETLHTSHEAHFSRMLGGRGDDMGDKASRTALERSGMAEDRGNGFEASPATRLLDALGRDGH